MAYVPTPPANTLVAPTASDLATYETGPDRFAYLGTLGSFRNFDAAAISVDPARFNCFAWSVGFTDRWIQGGTREDMVRLYEAYMFRQCQPAQAEVELYAIVNAPATLSRTIPGRRAQPARNGRPAVAATPDRVITYSNSRAVVMHAHRRDFPAQDPAPNRGCSSKLAAGPLIAHNRLALADNRPWGSGNPQIVYGAIYQWWQRDPAAHPTFPANAANAYPAPGHYPDDRVFSSGYGTYPPGHPGNTTGLPAANGGNNSRGAPSKTTTVARKAPVATKPWVFIAASGKPYPTIPLISPFARIPPASGTAVKAANAAVGVINKGNPTLVTAFTKAWAAFVEAWRELSRSVFCDDASVCMQTPEFAALVRLANAKTLKDVIALVVYKLATEPKSFVGVYVYNYLEKDAHFLVYKKDLFNYSVLQRHANLVVEMNAGRR